MLREPRRFTGGRAKTECKQEVEQSLVWLDDKTEKPFLPPLPRTRIHALTAQDTIRQAVERLAADPRPQRIILFGSQARGDATAGSDIDLLVIESEVTDRAAEMVRLRRLLGPLPAAFDLLVYTPQEVERWGRDPGSVVYWALQEGRVLHG